MIPRQWKLLLMIVAIIVIPAAGWMLRTYPPTQSTFYPKCVLHQWTGLHCPGCGGTRAVASLARGDWFMAMKFNPMLIIGGPLLVAVLWYKRRKERTQPQAMAKLSTFLAVVFILYFVIRNVPTPSTSPLAPPEPAVPQSVGEHFAYPPRVIRLGCKPGWAGPATETHRRSSTNSPIVADARCGASATRTVGR